MKQHTRLPLRILTILPIVPPLLLGLGVRVYGVNLPYWDEWSLAPALRHLAEGRFTMADLTAQYSASRMFFPKLLLLPLAELTHWNTRYEMLGSFLLACLAFANVAVLARRTVGCSLCSRARCAVRSAQPEGNPSDRAPRTAHCAREHSEALLPVLLFLSSALIFAPIQYENWLWGMQLIVYISIACITSALVVASSRLGAAPKLLICMLLATVSTFSFANGILAWVVILPVLALHTHPSRQSAVPAGRRGDRGDGATGGPEGTVLSPRRPVASVSPSLLPTADCRLGWVTLGWISGLLLNAFLYFHGYQPPAERPGLSLALTHSANAAVYFMGFLGGPFRFTGVLRPAIAALLFGLVAALLFGSAVLYFLRHFADQELRDRSIGWLMLGSYTILSALLAALERLGLGIRQSLSSRYATFSVYLVVALIFLAVVISRDLEKRSERFRRRKPQVTRAAAGCAGLLLLLHVTGSCYAVQQMGVTREARRAGKAALQFVNVAPEGILAQLVYPDVPTLAAEASAMDRLGFLSPPLVKSNRIEEVAVGTAKHKEPPRGPADGPAEYGRFEALTRQGGAYTATGWAVLPDRKGPADAVLLSYEDARRPPAVFAVVSLARFLYLPEGIQLRTMPRPDVAASNGGRYLNSGWQRIFSADKLPAGRLTVKAWAFDAEAGRAFPLQGAYQVER